MVYAEVVSYTIESFDWYQYASLLEKTAVCAWRLVLLICINWFVNHFRH